MVNEKDQNQDTTEETITTKADEAVETKGEPESKLNDEGVSAESAEPTNEDTQASSSISSEVEAAEEPTQAEKTAEETKEDDELAAFEKIIAELETELELAREEAARNLENWQRSAAETVNFKRRQEEQLKLQRDRIKSEVLEGVISALDDLDLAFQNLPEEIDGQLLGWVEGFRLVQRKLNKILDEQNVMPIDTSGKFDPNFHEAVSYEESDEHETEDIIGELRKGYQIGSRVIRPALVRVAK